MKIKKLLVANRGEIASRIFRTCRQLGIETVAVFSDADAEMPFVRDADEAMRIGPAASRESYLRVDRILAAAVQTGSNAVHPGFGFLAESAEFAQAVIDAGLIWVGPKPAAISAMGLKREAKEHASAAQVPVIPGFSVTDDVDHLREHASRLGYPILLKASAGGGGKGMRIVRIESELIGAAESARSEAKNAFGDETLIAEKYIERPRHIEIQVLGDEHGNVVHLFERECSIQRRHQKIVEEAPAPQMTDTLRTQMGNAAVSLCQRIGYSNAGTVEFIVAQDGQFYFLEVNTRLQVEHPVTEGIIEGLDLVEEQLRIACGEKLRWTRERLDQARRGASIEVRLCAEDPSANYLPQTGTLRDFHFPPSWLNQPWLRIESAVQSGTEVGIHYDSMIAKVIVSGPSRADAIDRLRSALRQLSVHGIKTNRALLLAICDDEVFQQGALHTHFLEERGLASQLLEVSPLSASVASLFLHLQGETARVLPGIPSAFRNAGARRYPTRLQRGELVIASSIRELARTPNQTRRHFIVDSETGSQAIALIGIQGATLVAGSTRGEVVFEHANRLQTARVTASEKEVSVTLDGVIADWQRIPRFKDVGGESAADGCVAPMPGKVLRVLVQVGQSVEANAPLLVLEAMKMEHTIRAPHAGVVGELRVAPGDQVTGQQLLVVLSEPAA